MYLLVLLEKLFNPDQFDFILIDLVIVFLSFFNKYTATAAGGKDSSSLNGPHALYAFHSQSSGETSRK